MYSKISLLNSEIKSLILKGNLIKALQLYSRSPLNVSRFSYPSLLKVCASLSNLHYGKTIHSTIITTGLHSDHYIAASLLNMYVKCGSLKDAVQVFDKFPDRELAIWNSMIDGYFRFGYFKEGFEQFHRMQSLGISPDAFSLCILLSVRIGDLGKEIHGYAVRNMLNSDSFLSTALIDAYFSCYRPRDACCFFEELKDKSNVVVWNVMIRGFSETGLCENSLKSFSLAKAADVKLVSASFTSTLSACCQIESVSFGKQVHCDVIKVGFEDDSYVRTSLLTMYAKSQLIEDAERVFNNVADKKIEVWNAMISAYFGNGCPYDALKIYNQMRLCEILPDSFTVSNVLSSVSAVEAYDFGRLVHTELVKRPIPGTITVQSALLTMYSKCGNDRDAYSIFSTMKERDVVAWSSMISGFCRNGKYKEAIEIFRSMEGTDVKPDSDIMTVSINACAGLEDADLGCMMHGVVIKSGLEFDSFVASSLIDMYSKYGFPDRSEAVFSTMHPKNLVAWNSMISCYSRNSLPEMSIGLFSEMTQHGLYPDSVSITSVLVAIASASVLLKGKSIHGYLVRHSPTLQNLFDLQVSNTLIDMYIKCGLLKYAEYIFRNMSEKNLVTWNSMISGYGSHGECPKAMRLFDEMTSCEITPDGATFLCLLSSCNHSGFVDKGLNLFQLMKRRYKIEPKMEHYVNIVDLFGRAGLVNDAYTFVEEMPIEPGRSIWLSLLCSCRTHQNVELGEMVADKLLRIEPSKGGNYVQLMNLYGESEMWEKAGKLRACMKEKGVKKTPGFSWIEVSNKVDVFFSGDCSSPRTTEIYQALNSLRKNMIKKGEIYEIVEEFVMNF
ncbi:pentatricopeptide repeat-containing protein At2g40720 [Euphorbia lathyris]|uniref:pentatricopeptide repeat-containing protein At2g40720 n=1 Tax=Euphorbia lathyris TaxID=212925 RepID=UPI0033131E13